MSIGTSARREYTLRSDEPHHLGGVYHFALRAVFASVKFSRCYLTIAAAVTEGSCASRMIKDRNKLRH